MVEAAENCSREETYSSAFENSEENGRGVGGAMVALRCGRNLDVR